MNFLSIDNMLHKLKHYWSWECSVVNRLSRCVHLDSLLTTEQFIDQFKYIYSIELRHSRVAQNLPKLENEISLVSMSVQYHSTLEKYKDLHSRAHIYIAHGPSKGPGPRYRPKIKVSQSTPCWYSKLVSQEAWKDAKD